MLRTMNHYLDGLLQGGAPQGIVNQSLSRGVWLEALTLCTGRPMVALADVDRLAEIVVLWVHFSGDAR
jgi:hypothetical protein